MGFAVAAESTDNGGSVWVSWVTGTESFVGNPQAPAYPSNFYKPQFADPAQTVSIVRHLLSHVWKVSPEKGFPFRGISSLLRCCTHQHAR